MTGEYRSRDGAALIVALSVLLVLLSIAITFLLIVRFESDMAGQMHEAGRADQLVDGALALAQHRLNRDLEIHPDALSLDHGWRTWFNGAAFVGKAWTREHRGAKAGVPLYFHQQGLVNVSIEAVERVLRAAPDTGLGNGLLYVRFSADRHIEPLFRGPRTAPWLHVPRAQGHSILLYAAPEDAQLVNSRGVPLDLARLNAALDAAGRQERVAHFDAANAAPPFVTAAFHDPTAGYPAEQVGTWTDVDTDGDGRRDALWMPLARDLDHYGDWIDNTLGGTPDPLRSVNGEWMPQFEAAPFVYHGLQRRFNPDPGEWIALGDDFDNDGNGTADAADEDRLFLTVPLPGMTMQVDLNSDGVFDERDHYHDPVGALRGPVYVRLPDAIQVTVIAGHAADGTPILGYVTLTLADLDVLDNDFDLITNGFRAYAYIGPHIPVPGAESFYHANQIPSTRAELDSAVVAYYNQQWRPHTHVLEDPNLQWLEADRADPLFAAAANRAYHDINTDVTFPAGVSFLVIDQAGVPRPEAELDPAFLSILRARNALRITCTGEPVSDIVGRAAIHIADEAGRVNLNTAGGHVLEGQSLRRALSDGHAPFEYETRILPQIGFERSRQFWGMRTGATEEDRFDVVPNLTSPSPQWALDVSAPGYGRADDDGNALLLALSGGDESGSGFIDGGLRLPRVVWPVIGLRGGMISPNPWVNAIDNFESIDRRFNDYLARIGFLDGIDEPAELRLYNPLHNFAAAIEAPGLDYGALSDRLLLKKEELTRHPDVGEHTWSFLRPLVTTHSESRNLFHVRGHGAKRAFLQVDPNHATAQQLAATLLIRGEHGAITDRLTVPDDIIRRYAEGLRQFDRSHTGALLGFVPDEAAGDPGGIFPADPMLQSLRLAVEIVAGRDRTAARHRLVTENFTRNPEIYRDLLGFVPVPPLEPLNERERIRPDELLPVGDIQEYLHDALGIPAAAKRLISPDLWWREYTGEDRVIQYAAAAPGSIRINEIMVRPVRRVEAEMDVTIPNLNPAPYPGMLPFDMERTSVLGANSEWTLRSAYDTPQESRPLLGERTAWEYRPSLPYVGSDVIEFRFRATDGLPPGRYYLTVNVTDALGHMTVQQPNILQYSVKYKPIGSGTGISEDMRSLLAALGDATDPGDAQAIADLIDGLWQTVDAPEFIASEAARAFGSAAPVGDVFLPVRNPGFYGGQTGPLGTLQTVYNALRDAGPLWIEDGVEARWIERPWVGEDGSRVGVLDFMVYWVQYVSGALPPVSPIPRDPAGWIAATVNDWESLVASIGPTPFDGDDQLRYRRLVMLHAWIQSFPLNADFAFYFADEVPGNLAWLHRPPTTAQSTFTVIVPHRDTGFEICVAFRLDPAALPFLQAGGSLAINFFDFSQEPSHEYLELVNVTDDEIDLGGWELEVGIPDPLADPNDLPAMRDPFKSAWRVPTGTRIAPRGYLLLGFDRLDAYRNAEVLDEDLPQGPLVGRNGMGLAAFGILDASDDQADAIRGLRHVTEPPIGTPMDWGPYLDGTGSVFRRSDTEAYDFIDNDGDGISSHLHVFTTFNPELDFDRVLEEYRTHGGQQPADWDRIPPWARIVQLENLRLWVEGTSGVYPATANPYRAETDLVTLREVDSLGRLARLVLRGGVFPNYPERDGIDNDGDGGYVYPDRGNAVALIDPALGIVEPLLRYTRGTLDKDMIDNNLDGRVDPCGVEQMRPPGVYEWHGNPLLSEGVDEGRLGVARMYGPGSHEAGVLPQVFLHNPENATVDVREAYRQWLDALPMNNMLLPGHGFPWWVHYGVPVPSPELLFDTLAQTVSPTPAPGLEEVDAAVSPEWKAFVERRWNPGDNVIVTLYVGRAADRRIADQATYREYDVINRTLDDVLSSPYGVPPYVAALDPARPSFWLPDHMGLDFYRALERKHPFYHGDRFGTANRWTATDGAYDDWADSLSVFTSIENRRAEGEYASIFPAVNRFADLDEERLFWHAFWGSPLRKNTVARIWENPRDLGRMPIPQGTAPPLPPLFPRDPADVGNRYDRQFAGGDAMRAGLLFASPAGEERPNADFALRDARLPKRPYATIGELLRLPMLQFHEHLHLAGWASVPGGGPGGGGLYLVERLPRGVMNLGMILENSAWDPAGAWRQDGTLLGASVAQAAAGGALPPTALRDAFGRPRPLGTDALEVSALRPVVLTVGQARVAPLWPQPDPMDPATMDALLQWNGMNPPHMWTPVYLFDMRWPWAASNPPGDRIERPWQQIRYPRDVVTGFELRHPMGGTPGVDAPSLLTPVYLFNGAVFAQRLFRHLPFVNLEDFVNTVGVEVWPRWPARRVASVMPTDADTGASADRAVMYVSQFNDAVGPAVGIGDQRRPEALFVWDRAAGLENGTYIAYVGTFLPGMGRKLRDLNSLLNQVPPVTGDPPHAPLLYGGVDPRTARILDMDPEWGGDGRFDPVLALEFITDRAYAEQMLPQGAPITGAPGLRHPLDWIPHSDAAITYRPRSDGYIFYSADPEVQWRPIPVRVTDNFLALRVRNLGGPLQPACITHVVLAPAPRTRGTVNLNTAETRQYIRGFSEGAANWHRGVFNALMGLPGVVNALEDTGLFRQENDLGLPEWIQPRIDGGGNYVNPWEPAWPTPEQLTGDSLPPGVNPREEPLLTTAETDTPDNWNAATDGRALLRLMALIAGNRTEHPAGRYYTSLAELAAGVGIGGESVPPAAGPWPLSNRNLVGPPDRIIPEERYLEIMERFTRLSNIGVTRSDVFEIVAIVQSGNVTDLNGDGVLDYRGAEFFPLAESRARTIYDRRARAARMDEARDLPDRE